MDFLTAFTAVIVGVLVTLIADAVKEYKQHGKEALRRLYDFIVEKQIFPRGYEALKSAFSRIIDKIRD